MIKISTLISFLSQLMGMFYKKNNDLGTNVFWEQYFETIDYGKMIISLPGSLSEFDFLNREWRFTSKNFLGSELAILGSSKALFLQRYRQ